MKKKYKHRCISCGKELDSMHRIDGMTWCIKCAVGGRVTRQEFEELVAKVDKLDKRTRGPIY